MAEPQQGASVVLPGGETFDIVNIARRPAPIPVLDGTHLLSTGSRVKQPGKLADTQVFTITAFNDPAATKPVRGLEGTLTITGPVPDGLSTGEIEDGTGFVVDYRGPEFGSETEAKQTIEIDVIWKSLQTITPAAA